MRNSVLPISFAIKKRIGAAKARSYNIILERLIAYHHGKNACRIHAYVSAIGKSVFGAGSFCMGCLGRGQKRIGMTPRLQKKTNFLAGGSMKRIKRTKVPGTRDTGGKAKGYSPSESNNIAVHLSISLNNYSKYIINNS